jgi:heterodisulfide reductase subunit A-like polyferredoxin
MRNIYHSDIYKFDTPVNSYWEDTFSENLNLEKLTKDINSEIVVIGGGYTGLLCAINLIENHNLDVILVEAGKIGWGASSRKARCLLKKCSQFLEEKRQRNFLKILLKVQTSQEIS